MKQSSFEGCCRRPTTSTKCSDAAIREACILTSKSASPRGITCWLSLLCHRTMNTLAIATAGDVIGVAFTGFKVPFDLEVDHNNPKPPLPTPTPGSGCSSGIDGY